MDSVCINSHEANGCVHHENIDALENLRCCLRDNYVAIWTILQRLFWLPILQFGQWGWHHLSSERWFVGFGHGVDSGCGHASRQVNSGVSNPSQTLMAKSAKSWHNGILLLCQGWPEQRTKIVHWIFKNMLWTTCGGQSGACGGHALAQCWCEWDRSWQPHSQGFPSLAPRDLKRKEPGKEVEKSEVVQLLCCCC